jgi:hypothetical protein
MRLLRAGVGLAVLVAAGALAAGSEGGRSTSSAGSSNRAEVSFTAIAHGNGFGGHYCAITNTGGAVCWGANDYGQVGDGTHGDRYRPVRVVGLDHGVKQITVSTSHACALTTAGAVKCWGKNLSGQLGNGTTKGSYVPVDVVGLSSGVRQISAGDFHTCALLNSGGVDCWGGNRASEDNVGFRPVPVKGLPAGIVSITAATFGNNIASGWGNGMETCALLKGGAVSCWDKTGPPERPFTALASGVAAITSTAFVANWCVLTTEGAVNCDGQVISNLEHAVKAIDDDCALTDTGGVKCWYHGAVKPAQDVPGLTGGVKAIAGHCAVLDSGWIKCWGCPFIKGSLGNGQKSGCANTPVAVLSPIPAGSRAQPVKPASPGRSTSPARPGARARPGATLALGGGCSSATAAAIARRLHLGNADFTTVPVAQVLCGPFTGPGSDAIVFSLTVPGCGRTGDWVVFAHQDGVWRYLFERRNGADLAKVAGDGIRETQNVLQPGDAHCFPTGGTRSRVWHWNEGRFVSGAWQYSKPHRSSSPKPTTPAVTSGSTQALRAYTVSLETFLNELARGRAQLKTALGGATGCTTSYQAAANQVLGVINNRSVVWNQLNATHPPSTLARTLQRTLMSAVESSIAADRRYRDWLLEAASAHAACPPPTGAAAYRSAAQLDVTATRVKQRFAAAFNPLARRQSQRAWSADEF